MKNTFTKILASLCLYQITLQSVLHSASADGNGLLDGVVNSEENMSATERIRTGSLHLDDIPNILKHLIDVFIGLAGTVAVLFVIIGGYKLLFGALKQDHTKGRETIIMALTGFAIAVLAWAIVQFIFDNL